MSDSSGRVMLTKVRCVFNYVSAQAQIAQIKTEITRIGTRMDGLNELSYKVIGLGMRVHSRFGPGLFESVYEVGLADELTCAGIPFERQKVIWVPVRGDHNMKSFRVDLLLEGMLIVEVKSAPFIDATDTKQVLTYLRLLRLRLGLILNNGTPSLGIRRVINGY